MASKKPGAETKMEAQAADLNPRGLPYRYFDRDFPPGEWIEVSENEALQLRFSPLKVRQKKAD